jgi:hypothetical protein
LTNLTRTPFERQLREDPVFQEKEDYNYNFFSKAQDLYKYEGEIIKNKFKIFILIFNMKIAPKIKRNRFKRN